MSDVCSSDLMLRIAASTRWVTWVSISVGAAPGWLMSTSAPGKSMSGSFCTSMRTNEISPARVSATNRTIGGIGLRIDQAEMLRKFMARPSARGLLPDRSDLLARVEEAAGGLHDPLGSVQAFDDGDTLVGRSEEHTSELQSLMRISNA